MVKKLFVIILLILLFGCYTTDYSGMYDRSAVRQLSCSYCNGSGQVRCSSHSGYSCIFCNGTGFEKCSFCKGSGKR